MCNKIIENNVLHDFYKEIKNLLDILEIARNDGLQQGIQQGIQQGRLLNAREMLLDIIDENIGVVPTYIAEKINAINKRETLKSLHRQALKCNDIKLFEESLRFASN